MSKHSGKPETVAECTRTKRELAFWGAYCAIRHELAGDTMMAEQLSQLLFSSTILKRALDDEERKRVIALLD